MNAFRTATALLLLAAATGAAPAAAQDAATQLPDSVATRVVAFYNQPGTIRLAGESTLPAGASVTGNVAVLGGPFILGGRIEGDVLVINGDLRLQRDAEVTGHVIVVGGGVVGEGQARIGGGLEAYREPLRFRQEASGLVHAPLVDTGISAGRDFPFGRTELLIAARHDYNRVEGLPIEIGPRIRFGRINPTVFEALAIYRSSAGVRIDPDRMGYSLRLEQFLAGGRTARIGLGAYSDITAIEDRGLSERENSLSTFVLHKDLRDTFERRGWLAWFRYARAGWPHDLTVEYRDETNTSVAPGSPWSLLDNDQPWRAEPLIAEGRTRSLTGRFVYDTRNEVADPAAGWYIAAEAEQGLSGDIRRPAAVNVVGDTVPATPARELYTHAALDVRRYVRLGPGSRMAFRAYAAGSPNGLGLPAQRQHTLGGEGSLPGYATFEFDCNARNTVWLAGADSFYPNYGCSRVALVQLEYQAAFPFLARQFGALGRSFDLEHLIRWVVFFNAGRAWNEPEALDAQGSRPGVSGMPPPITGLGARDFAADAGFGVRLGPVGIYWAVPLSSAGQGINFFIRLGPRL
ncbi:MAG: BamA/TamA family outer membrane protein [Gemmatimonadota bacterium]|jgi:hypothetical protein